MWKSRLLLSLLLVAAVPIGAMTVLPIDVATQVDRAELIFVGTVIEVKSVPVKDGSTAYTYVTFAVDETLKGAASGPMLTLRFYGGQAGGYVYEIAGAPKFREGGKHLLFVEANERYMIPLTGGPQGKLDLVTHPVTQELMVVDSARRAIDGLRDKNWSRSGLQLDRFGEILRRQAAATVVSEEGVKIELDRDGASAKAEEAAPPASNVIAALRSLVHERAFAPEFKRAAVVQSASPSNVPDTNPHKQFRRAAAK